jgi:hypothetical protein
MSIVAAQAGVALVEPGHSLNQLVDSAVPLDPSQTALEAGCVGGVFPGVCDTATGLCVAPPGSVGFPCTVDSDCDVLGPFDIESIGIDRAAGGLLYVQLENPAGSFTSATTCIASVTRSVPGTVAIINPSTGFGINERGTDLHFDPGSGLLVTQDQNWFNTPAAAERIATVNPVGGATGTYSLVTPGIFLGNTFGMGFSAGLGGSDVLVGDIVFTADVTGNGLHSATFGGGASVLHEVPPGQAGDDMVIQPNGDWVHVPDFTGVISSYSPIPPALPHPPAGPHVRTPSVTGLNVQGIFTGAFLPFVHGSRAAVCPTTGEVYVSYSGSPGGTGIFRVDPTLTVATHVLTITDEGLHDLVVGPSTSGSGNSVYFTIHDPNSAGEEVWEVTAPACEAECDADPHTQGYWHRQCLGAGLITPGRNGRGPQETTEPDFLKTLEPAVNARLQASIFIPPTFLTCEDGMDAIPPSDPCERALKQYTALLLNLESGRLQDGCNIDLSAEGCSSTNIGDLVNELAGLINSGDPDDCKQAAACAGAVNENQGIVPLAPAPTAPSSMSSPFGHSVDLTVSSAYTVTPATSGGTSDPREAPATLASPVASGPAPDAATTPEATSRTAPSITELRQVYLVPDASGLATPRAPTMAADRGTNVAATGTSDAGGSIDRHLAILANVSAPEDARKVSEDALLTALGGGYEPEVRIQIVRGLLGKVDVAYNSLLAKHLEDIRLEAQEIGNEKVLQEAARLLKNLEPSRESEE